MNELHLYPLYARSCDGQVGRGHIDNAVAAVLVWVSSTNPWATVERFGRDLIHCLDLFFIVLDGNVTTPEAKPLPGMYVKHFEILLQPDCAIAGLVVHGPHLPQLAQSFVRQSIFFARRQF